MLFLSKYDPSLIMRKTSDMPWLRDILQSILPGIFKTMKVIENRESLRNCHNQEEGKETWWLNTSNLDGILRQTSLEKKMKTSE